MRSIFFGLFCFSLACCANAQDLITIQGKVIDSLTKEPLPLAQVFIEGTTKGTTTNLDGEFILSVYNTGNYEIVCYFVGYQSSTKLLKATQITSYTLNFALLTDEVELSTVEVSSTRDKDWSIHLKRFKEDFFGRTDMAEKTVLLNPEVIDFTSKNTDKGYEIQGKASTPLLIENKGLGYKIYCNLDDYQNINNKQYSYLGKFRFEEIPAEDQRQANKLEKNREKAYKGSLRHFLQSLVADKLKEEGYLLFNERNEALKAKDLLTPTESPDTWIMFFYGVTRVVYSKESEELEYAQLENRTPLPNQTSLLELVPKNSSILLDKNGYIFNPLNLMVYGYWYWEKVADMVPLDYIPEKK
ncbi:MAG TPA: hypothetical protein DCM08_03755 [Microscillaceae bacterium]|nr:hypothetical protein [Microscillaceae bacterium]